jgi:hypothetical protein
MKRWFAISLAAGLLVAPAEPANAQFKFFKKIPGLSKLFERKPAITTSIEDAVTQVPFLDGFDPGDPEPMALLPRTPDGGFILERPGNYLFEARSYCLAPGRHAPSGESGYVYAPLRGPRAGIVHSVLRRSYSHPEIDQQQIQALLWAIISRTRFDDLSPQLQRTAADLLTPQEIRKLKRGGLDLIPEEVWDEAFGHLPAEVRAVMEAEAHLRDLLSDAGSTYEELEEVAVLAGVAPLERGGPDVPPGRWSYHSDGYFLRFFPRGYRRMLIQLYLPEPYAVGRDAAGRVTEIAGPDRARLTLSYDDRVKPLDVAGELDLAAWAFNSVRCDRWSPQRQEWPEKPGGPAGWTFVGVPGGGGRPVPASDRFTGLARRYDWAERHRRELHRLEDGLTKLKEINAPRRMNAADLDRIMAIGHLARGMEEAGEVTGIEMAKRAWQHSLATALVSYRNSDSIDESGHVVFDPAADPTSGNSGEQTEGDSPQGTDDDEECADQHEECLDGVDDIAALDFEDCYNGIGKESGECDPWGLDGCLTALPLVDSNGEIVWETMVDPGKCIDHHCSYFEGGVLGMSGSQDLSLDQLSDLLKCLNNALEDWDRNQKRCKEDFPCD